MDAPSFRLPLCYYKSLRNKWYKTSCCKQSIKFNKRLDKLERIFCFTMRSLLKSNASGKISLLITTKLSSISSYSLTKHIMVGVCHLNHWVKKCAHSNIDCCNITTTTNGWLQPIKLRLKQLFDSENMADRTPAVCTTQNFIWRSERTWLIYCIETIIAANHIFVYILITKLVVPVIFCVDW